MFRTSRETRPACFNAYGKGKRSVQPALVHITEGTAPAPKLTLTMALPDYVDMVTGKLNSMAAFSSGKLKLGGDMMFAMKLASFFGASV